MLGKPICIVRPGSVIGTNEQPQHLIPKLIDSCLHHSRMDFVKEPTHDFVDVRDVVDAMLLIAENAKAHPGQTFEVARGKAVSNKEVLDLVEKTTKGRANLHNVESLRPYDNTDWKLDNSAIKELGWRPQYTLRQTIKEMVNDRT